MPDLLGTVELQTRDVCECSVIWMHGLGADGADFVPLIPKLGLNQDAASDSCQQRHLFLREISPAPLLQLQSFQR